MTIETLAFAGLLLFLLIVGLVHMRRAAEGAELQQEQPFADFDPDGRPVIGDRPPVAVVNFFTKLLTPKA